MKNKVSGMMTLLVTVTFLMAGCATIPKKTEPLIPKVREKSKLKDFITELAHVQLANQNLTGLKANRVNEVLALPDDQVDLATAILLISKRCYKDFYRTDIDIDKYRKRLDEMAITLSEKIELGRNPEKIIQMMNHYLFQEEKFSSDLTDPTGGNPENLFLNSVLNRKKGYCLSLSILYLSVAERIGLPLYGVYVPGHFFVRYDDKIKRINIETTDRGKSFKDGYYIEEFEIPKDGSSYFLKNVGKKGVIGCFLIQIGHIYREKGMVDEAISEYKKALVINPNDAVAHTNLGNAYVDKWMINEAILEHKKALAIIPNLAVAHNNLSAAYFCKREFKLAIKHCDRAIELGYRVYPKFLELLEPYR